MGQVKAVRRWYGSWHGTPSSGRPKMMVLKGQNLRRATVSPKLWTGKRRAGCDKDIRGISSLMKSADAQLACFTKGRVVIE